MIIKQNSITQPFIPVYNQGQKYVRFGRNNNFPKEALDLINNSPLQRVIIDKTIDYTYGLGLANYTGSEPNYTETWDELLQRCITDYIIFGAFSVQIIKVGTRFLYYHQPVNEVRMMPLNNKNKCEGYYISSKWQRNSTVDDFISAFGTEIPKEGKAYLLYFKEYIPGEYYYAVPAWWSAANWIAADAKLSKYYNNFISNNMSANIAISYPSEPDESKKQFIYDSLRECFSGEDNAGSILLLFGEGGNKPEIENISTTNADLYNTVQELVQRNILTANNVSSPSLFGINTTSGFSSQSDEMIAAYTLYKDTVIQPIRNFVLKKFNYLRGLNNEDSFELLDINIVRDLEGGNNENKINEANEV